MVSIVLDVYFIIKTRQWNLVDFIRSYCLVLTLNSFIECVKHVFVNNASLYSLWPIVATTFLFMPSAFLCTLLSTNNPRGLVFSRASLTSQGEGASLALVGHPSSDGVTIKMPYGVDVLHRPTLHPIFSYWVG